MNTHNNPNNHSMTWPPSDPAMWSYSPPDCLKDNKTYATLDLIDTIEFYFVTPPYSAAAAVPTTLLDLAWAAHIDTLAVLPVPAAASAPLAVGAFDGGTLIFAAVAADPLTLAGVCTLVAAAVGTYAAVVAVGTLAAAVTVAH